MEDCHWPNVKSEIVRPTENERGCFYLHVPPLECPQVWERIRELTTKGHLGYMSSKSPEITLVGEWAGNNLICVHTIHVGRDSVRSTLEMEGLVTADRERDYEYDYRSYTNKWSVDEGYWVNRVEGNE